MQMLCEPMDHSIPVSKDLNSPYLLSIQVPLYVVAHESLKIHAREKIALDIPVGANPCAQIRGLCIASGVIVSNPM